MKRSWPTSREAYMLHLTDQFFLHLNSHLSGFQFVDDSLMSPRQNPSVKHRIRGSLNAFKTFVSNSWVLLCIFLIFVCFNITINFKMFLWRRAIHSSTKTVIISDQRCFPDDQYQWTKNIKELECCQTS